MKEKTIATKKAADTSDRQIVTTRLIHAPRELVFEMFANPDHVVQWWGPNGFTNTTQQRAFRKGGSWQFIMHGPDGKDYANLITFTEIRKPEFIAYHHGTPTPIDSERFESTISFDAQGDATLVTLTAVFASKEFLEMKVKTVNAIEGGKQTLSRLAQHAELYAMGLTQGSPAVVFTRMLSAPREKVFKGWTDPKELAKWWGPRMFSNPVCKFEAKVGGSIHIDMKGPDGNVYPMDGEVLELIPNEKLVFSSIGMKDKKGNVLLSGLTTVHFTEENGKTKMVVLEVMTKVDEKAAGALAGMEAGWDQSLDKFTEIVSPKDVTDTTELVIIREVNAPRELVYQLWTQEKHLNQWWGPKGMAIKTKKLDVVPGGIFHYSMTPPGGQPMWGRFMFVHLQPPERIEFINSFSNEKGEIGDNPWMPVWAKEIHNTLTFTEAGKKTILTLRGHPINCSAAEMAAFKQMISSMQGGFKGTFEKLDEYLAQLKAK